MEKPWRILVGAVIFVAGFLLGQGVALQRTTPAQPASQDGVSEFAVHSQISVMVDFGNGRVEVVPLQTYGYADSRIWTALSALEAAATTRGWKLEVKDYGEMGNLVESIDGRKNATDDRYWQYWVNHQYAQVAADRQTIAQEEGPQYVEWKFLESQPISE